MNCAIAVVVMFTSAALVSTSLIVANPNFWFDIPGSQTVTNLNISINPAQLNVFYRLRHP